MERGGASRARQQCHNKALLSIIPNHRGELLICCFQALQGVGFLTEHIRDPELLWETLPSASYANLPSNIHWRSPSEAREEQDNWGCVAGVLLETQMLGWRWGHN